MEMIGKVQNFTSALKSNSHHEIITETMLPSLSTAIISQIPKSGKYQIEMGNYRSMSLLNCDYKILAKILALHLETVAPSVVHIDLVGFIPGHGSSNNMQRLFQVKLSGKQSSEPGLATPKNENEARLALYIRVALCFICSTNLDLTLNSSLFIITLHHHCLNRWHVLCNQDRT